MSACSWMRVHVLALLFRLLRWCHVNGLSLNVLRQAMTLHNTFRQHINRLSISGSNYLLARYILELLRFIGGIRWNHTIFLRSSHTHMHARTELATHIHILAHNFFNCLWYNDTVMVRATQFPLTLSSPIAQLIAFLCYY